MQTATSSNSLATAADASLGAADLALLAEAAAGTRALRDQVGRAIIGQQDTVDALLAPTLAEGHVLLVGVPGLAKTLLVKTLASALGWRSARIQFTPDMMPADIIGMEILQEDGAGGRAMRFVPGPVFAHIVLADEINRTPPKTQAALLEAMQERQVTSMGKRHALERPFMVVATQNPIEQEGTYPLPEAQLDRFMFSLWLDYPSREEEEAIVSATTAPHEVEVQAVFSREKLLAFQQLVARVPAGKQAVAAAVAIARATRPGSSDAPEFVRRYVEWGAGPRAAQHMILAGKALAVMAGEPAVTLAHIRRAAPLVLRHRVLANFQAAGDRVDATRILESAVAHALGK